MKQQDNKMVASFRKLSEEEFEKMNYFLKPYSATCPGGSHVLYSDGSAEVFIGIDMMKNTMKGYSEQRLAGDMRREFGYQNLALNGRRV